MRIHKNDHLMENSLIFCQILPTDSLRKCMEISMENLYVDIGIKWVQKVVIPMSGEIKVTSVKRTSSAHVVTY